MLLTLHTWILGVQHGLSGSPFRYWQGAVETPNCLWLHPVYPLGPASSVPAPSSTPHATRVVRHLTTASPARCHRSRYQTHSVTAPVASIAASVISYLGRRRHLLECDFCMANWSEILIQISFTLILVLINNSSKYIPLYSMFWISTILQRICLHSH